MSQASSEAGVSGDLWGPGDRYWCSCPVNHPFPHLAVSKPQCGHHRQCTAIPGALDQPLQPQHDALQDHWSRPHCSICSHGNFTLNGNHMSRPDCFVRSHIKLTNQGHIFKPNCLVCAQSNITRQKFAFRAAEVACTQIHSSTIPCSFSSMHSRIPGLGLTALYRLTAS